MHRKMPLQRKGGARMELRCAHPGQLHVDPIRATDKATRHIACALGSTAQRRRVGKHTHTRMPFLDSLGRT